MAGGHGTLNAELLTGTIQSTLDCLKGGETEKCFR